jgi:hypothetical protein
MIQLEVFGILVGSGSAFCDLLKSQKGCSEDDYVSASFTAIL